MPSESGGEKIKHQNEERTVECPVEGCGEEVLARGLHLHVMRTSGNGHGPQNELPDHIDLDEAKTVGKREVEMEYPEERESESVARLCPYCERPFRGKYGVMIHLGQMAGRKNHPENPKELHDPEDFSIVHVDDDENVVEVVEESTSLPSTERRQAAQKSGEAGIDEKEVRKHIEELREQGLDKQADRAEKMLLGN